jgi:hypothetical protein
VKPKKKRVLKSFVALVSLCFAVSASAKLGETVPQLVKRFGKSYTVEEIELGETYRFRSEKVSVDVLVAADGVSVAETYFSDHPLTSSGEPPNDIVRAVLKTNVLGLSGLKLTRQHLEPTTRCSPLTTDTSQYLDTRGRNPNALDSIRRLGYRRILIRKAALMCAVSTDITCLFCGEQRPLTPVGCGGR